MMDKYDSNSIYLLDEMPSTDDDYKLINKCFVGNICYQDNSKDFHYQLEAKKIYRVKKLYSDGISERKADNMLLFHGTEKYIRSRNDYIK